MTARTLHPNTRIAPRPDDLEILTFARAEGKVTVETVHARFECGWPHARDALARMTKDGALKQHTRLSVYEWPEPFWTL